jgi:hypothetical protein
MKKEPADQPSNDDLTSLERLHRQMKREHAAWEKLIKNIEKLKKNQNNPSNEHE